MKVLCWIPEKTSVCEAGWNRLTIEELSQAKKEIIHAWQTQKRKSVRELPSAGCRNNNEE